MWCASRQKTAREYRLFAKSKEMKDKVMTAMARLVEQVNKRLAGVVTAAWAKRERLSKYAKVATDKVQQLHETMTKLLPQIRYWLKTGNVASGKVISLHLPELYSIVRGKVGKTVEFGLSWGFVGRVEATCSARWPRRKANSTTRSSP
jgi:hypothetical protein